VIVQVGAAVARYYSQNRKLSPVEHVPDARLRFKKFKIVRRRPYVASTAVSIEASCPDRCRFKAGGCYAKAGFAGRSDKLLTQRWDRRRGPDGPMLDEAEAIDRIYVRGVAAHGGKDGSGPTDIRVHDSGDVTSEWGARIIARAIERYQARGGGAAWTYTHRWDEVSRDAWGPIHVLASVETRAEFRAAVQRGYVPAIVLPKLEGDKPFAAGVGNWRVLPCPYETRGVTCVKCRMCLGEVDLRKAELAIGFGVHGKGAAKAAQALTQLRLPMKEV